MSDINPKPQTVSPPKKPKTLTELATVYGQDLIRGDKKGDELDKLIKDLYEEPSTPDLREFIKLMKVHMDPQKFYDFTQKLVLLKDGDPKTQTIKDYTTFLRAEGISRVAFLSATDETKFRDNIKQFLNQDVECVSNITSKIPDEVFQQYLDMKVPVDQAYNNILFNFVLRPFAREVSDNITDKNERNVIILSQMMLQGVSPHDEVKILDGKEVPQTNKFKEKVKALEMEVETDPIKLEELKNKVKEAKHDPEKLIKLAGGNQEEEAKLKRLDKISKGEEFAKSLYDKIQTEKKYIEEKYKEFMPSDEEKDKSEKTESLDTTRSENKEKTVKTGRPQGVEQKDRDANLENFNKLIEERKLSQQVIVSGQKGPQQVARVSEKIEKKSLFVRFKEAAGWIGNAFKSLFSNNQVGLYSGMARTAVKSTTQIPNNSTGVLNEEKDKVIDTAKKIDQVVLGKLTGTTEDVKQVTMENPQSTTTVKSVKKNAFRGEGFTQYNSQQLSQDQISDVYGELRKNIVLTQNEIRKSPKDNSSLKEKLFQDFINLNALRDQAITCKSKQPDLDGPWRENINHLIDELQKNITKTINDLSVEQKSKFGHSKFKIDTTDLISPTLITQQQKVQNLMGELKEKISKKSLTVVPKDTQVDTTKQEEQKNTAGLKK